MLQNDMKSTRLRNMSKRSYDTKLFDGVASLMKSLSLKQTLVALFIFSGVFCPAAVAAKATRTTAYDCEGVAGEEVTLKAEIESRLFNWLPWDSTGGLTVKIYVDGTDQGSVTSTSWGKNVSFKFTIPPSWGGTTKRWYAKFEGNSDFEPSSDEAILTVKPRPNRPPTTPKNLRVDPDSITETSAEISWDASTDPDGDTIYYRVEYGRNDITGDGWTVAVEKTTRTYCIIENLVRDKPYDVRVRALDSKEAHSDWNDSRDSHPEGLFRTKPVHSVEAPTKPVPSKTIFYTYEKITFTTSHPTGRCSWGHDVQYRFFWDRDNNENEKTSWGDKLSRERSYDKPGIYKITAQARCTKRIDSVRLESPESKPCTVKVIELPGSIKVDITPISAVNAGAKWKATNSKHDTGWQVSGAVVDVPAGEYTITFNMPSGWNSPSGSGAKPADITNVSVPSEACIQRTGTYQRIISAYWWAPTDVMEGTKATACAEVEGFSIGDQFEFRIRESDRLTRAEYGPYTGKVYEAGGKQYVKYEWPTVWENDIVLGVDKNPPEFEFTVSRGSLSYTSDDNLIVRRKPALINQGISGFKVYKPDGTEVTGLNVPYTTAYLTYKLAFKNESEVARKVRITFTADRDKSGGADFAPPAQTTSISAKGTYTFSFGPHNAPASGAYHGKFVLEAQDNDQWHTVESADWTNRPIVTVDSRPDYAAEIREFYPPSGNKARQSKQETIVTIKNTGAKAHAFWVGLSFLEPNAGSWPVGWYDIMPQETPVLQPNETYIVKFTFTIPPSLPPGTYEAVTAVWEGYDKGSHKMLPITGEAYDSAPGVGFTLSDYEDPAGPLVNQLRSIVGEFIFDREHDLAFGDMTQRYRGSPSNRCEKLLLFVKAEASGPLGTTGVRLDGKGAILIDLADLFSVTPEGNGDGDGEQWVTVWVDAGVSLSTVIPNRNEKFGIDMGVTVYDFKFGEQALADDREGTKLGGINLPFITFSGITYKPGTGWKKPTLKFTTNFAFNVDIVNATALKAVEINKRVVMDALNTESQGEHISDLARSIVNYLVSGHDNKYFRHLTYDDGFIYLDNQGSTASPLYCNKSNNNQGHLFYVDVPENTASLSFGTNALRSSVVDLYVSRSGCPGPDNYLYYFPATSEHISIDNPLAGKYFIKVQGSYENISLWAVTTEGKAPREIIIEGSDSIAYNECSEYLCKALYDNAPSHYVAPRWSIYPTEYASVTTEGYVRNNNNTGSSQYVTLCANYGEGNVAKEANKKILLFAAAPPTVTTGTISSITQTTATVAGSVTHKGDANVIARGICWSTKPNPTIADNVSKSGSGVGYFSCILTGLTGDTEYYVRAYATSNVGTGYGSQNSFVTPPYPWGSNSQPYGVFDDLASEVFEGNRHDSPNYRYYYCRRGVLISHDNVPILEPYADLGFNSLTQSPPATDTFLMRSLISSTFDVQPENCFRSHGEFIPWQHPDFSGKFTWLSTKLHIKNAPAGYAYHLFRRLHPKTSLTDSITGSQIGQASKKIVVLIHGWNSKSDNDPFQNRVGEDGNWQSARDAIKRWLLKHSQGEWSLVEFNWAADADTGPVFWGSDASRSVDTWPTQNGTEAAETAHFHGQVLGELLRAASPGLLKVQFIAHSAGAWCARTAARHLLINSTAQIQVTLLDPYMPREGDADSLLGREIIGRLDTDYSRQPTRLENYYSKYDEALGDTVFFNSGTAQQFDWSCPSVQKQLDYSPDGMFIYGNYTTHGGPIAYYADTVTGNVVQESFWGDWIGANYGWRISLPYMDLRPTVETKAVSAVTSTSASSGGNVTNPGRTDVTARGVCWSTHPNPTTGDAKTNDGSGSGAFVSMLTGLLPNTKYYVRAYATNNGGTSYGGTVSFTTLESPTVDTPTFNPDGGTHLGTSVKVTVSCSTPGATIRYTTDGSEPTKSDPTVASGTSVQVPVAGTLKAKAWKDGMNPSKTKTAEYSSAPTVDTPTFNPDGGAHPGDSVKVTVSCSTPGATIRYTTDGSEPTKYSQTVASGSIVQVPLPKTLKAKAWKDGMNPSKTKTAEYSEKPKPLVFWDGNLHFYELIEVPEGITWDQAKIAAESTTRNGIPGHLATITSAEENSFIVEAFQELFTGGVWIGADQEPGNAPDHGWRWATGEPWIYTNWRSAIPEPNDANGNHEEDALEFMILPREWYSHGYWNDMPRTSKLYYYLIEYPSMYCRRSTGGSINDQVVDAEHDTVSVIAGERLQGSFNVMTNNTMHSGAVAPLAATVTWGDRTTQHWTVNRKIRTGVNTYSIPVNCVAPDTPGDYYLIVGFSGMYTGAQVMSSTTPARDAVWHDGNDVGFDWTEAQFNSALGNTGVVWVNMLQTNNEFPICAQPFTAIKIHVEKALSAEYSLNEGWNLISINLDLTEKSQQTLRSKKAMTLSPTGHTYVFSDHLAPTQACWIYCRTAETFTLTGASPENLNFAANLKTGWNFVGPTTDSLLRGNGAIAWGWNRQNFYPTRNMGSGSGYYLYWPEDQAEVIPDISHAVTFDLGTHGVRIGGGELSQSVKHLDAAKAPAIMVEKGWTFHGWSHVFENVSCPLLVVANYSATGSDELEIVVQIPPGCERYYFYPPQEFPFDNPIGDSAVIFPVDFQVPPINLAEYSMLTYRNIAPQGYHFVVSPPQGADYTSITARLSSSYYSFAAPIIKNKNGTVELIDADIGNYAQGMCRFIGYLGNNTVSADAYVDILHPLAFTEMRAKFDISKIDFQHNYELSGYLSFQAHGEKLTVNPGEWGKLVPLD